ncbi:collagenase 3-like [Podarcis muralis]
MSQWGLPPDVQCLYIKVPCAVGRHHRLKTFSSDTGPSIRSTMNGALICMALFLPYSLAVPIAHDPEAQSVEDMKFVEAYLDKYFPSSSSHLKSGGQSIEEKLRQMQSFFHLTVTGKMNQETMATMEQPRCGVSDISEKSAVRWGKTLLTYRINNYTPDMLRSKVEEAIAKAFKVWSDVTPLQFRRTSRPADIEIWFATGAHGDGSPFDGRGGTLAHAYFPGRGIGGDAHFDDSERFSEFNREINLFLVAAHEFGHSLGLSHSNVRGSLMFPSYSFVNPNNFNLPNNDRQRIQRLYGLPK